MKKKIRKSEKQEAYSDVKKQIDEIISTLEVCTKADAELYTCDLRTACKIASLDAILYPFRDGSRRGSAYSVDKIINIINPGQPAYDFDVVEVFKYQYVNKKESCLRMLPKTLEVSHNFERKKLREEIKEEKYSNDLAEKRTAELNKRLEEESLLINDIIENNNEYSIVISGYMHKVKYEQINYGIKKVIDINDESISKKIRNKAKLDGYVKTRLNKHLSIRKPNIIIYEPDKDMDEQRADMEVKYLAKRGFKVAARGIFYKKIESKG